MRDIQQINAMVVITSTKLDTSGDGTRPGLLSQDMALQGTARAAQIHATLRWFLGLGQRNGIGQRRSRRQPGGKGQELYEAGVRQVPKAQLKDV